MKKIIISCFTLMSLSVNAMPLHNFKDIVHKLDEGKKVSFVLDLKQCVTPEWLDPMIVSISPESVLRIGNKIFASTNCFALEASTDPAIPTFNYARYTVNEDGSASVAVTVMNAATYQSIRSYNVECTLDKGLKVFG